MRGTAIATLLAISLSVAACSSDGATVATTSTTAESVPATLSPRRNGTFDIGMLLPTTGPGKALAEPMAAAVELAIRDINAAGGVNGTSVTLVSADEGADTTTAAAGLTKLLEEGKVDAIVGLVSSRNALSLVERLNRNQVPTCSPAATTARLTTADAAGYFFRTIPSDRLEALAIAEAITRTGRRRTAIVVPDDEYGVSMATVVAGGLQRRGAEAVATVSYDSNATEFNDVAAKVFGRDPQPDSVAFVGVPEPGASVLGSLRTAGGGAVQIVVSSGLRQSNLFSATEGGKPETLDRIRGVSPWALSVQGAWTERFKAATDNASDLYAAYAYDCATLLALAASSAGSDDGRLVASELIPLSLGGTSCFSFVECGRLIDDGNNVDYVGVSGPVDLNTQGDPQAGRFDVFTFDATGRDISGEAVDISG